MAAWQVGKVLRREPFRSIWVILGTAVACYNLERWVLAWLHIGTNTPPLNPVAGLALALMLLYGPSALIGILIASCWSAKTQGMPWEAIIGTTFGNGVATGLGYWFMRRLNVSPMLHRVRDIMLFILFAALLPSSLNATISSLSRSFGNILPLPVMGSYWWSLWRADSLGILTVAPLLLTFNHGRPLDWQWVVEHSHPRQLRRLFQPRNWAIVLWLFAVGLSSWITVTHAKPSIPWLEYLPFFCLAWAVARFGQRGSIFSGFLIVSLAAWYTFHGSGLFLARGGNLELGITDFQSWSTIVLAISLVTGAAVQERQTLIDQLQANSRSLNQSPPDGDVERLLNEVSNRIRQSLNISEILQQTVEEVRQLLNADRVCLFQANESGEGFVSAESVIDAWPSILGTQIPAEIVTEMQGRYQNQPVQVRDDVRTVEVTPFLQAAYERYKIRSSLTTSLEQDGQPFGLLVIHQCQAARQWQPAEVDLIKRLAPQIELAIQQGNLYNNLQTHANTMETEVRDRTEQLRHNITEFMDRDQARQQLLHAVNHDLRTPVLGMLMVLQKLAMQSGDRISLPKSILDRMLESSNRQIDLIQALLDEYADMPDPRFQPNPEALNCHSLIAHALNQLQPITATHQGNIQNQISIDLPDIQGDATYLQRVFENLISNAIQHNSSTTTITIAARVLPAQEHLFVEVKDNGVGLSPEQQHALFIRPYPRGKFDRRLTGLGLGLFLCHQIIQAHMGELGVESERNAGSTFWFTLPLAQKQPTTTTTDPDVESTATSLTQNIST
ncbi:MASE1 domain-containing protein [filamentous cyanobacterium LEGE 11480]|uniref:histidine kinase n=1 Tax=Romeriopsis navalis LEGE 11480 TaxID=2777977 RepID=A0A928VIK8_9CYAN|nr:ATP-binding protein [Romeriopsis navalis]MBE9028347.1 MASE1 domain-containing protein [Romeriopsis navalis LEGE 11480]